MSGGERSAETAALNETAQIFYQGAYPSGDWGWQCFICREESTGYGNATTAADGRDQHVSLCPAEHVTPTGQADRA